MARRDEQALTLADKAYLLAAKAKDISSLRNRHMDLI